MKSLHHDSGNGKPLGPPLDAMLSIGSAADVAVMGTAHGIYTFFGQLKWARAMLLGYLCSIGVNFLVNASKFS